jgi:hypothetical protein
VPGRLRPNGTVDKVSACGKSLVYVEAAFFVSERQAIRYKRQAEEMGFISDE